LPERFCSVSLKLNVPNGTFKGAKPLSRRRHPKTCQMASHQKGAIWHPSTWHPFWFHFCTLSDSTSASSRVPFRYPYANWHPPTWYSEVPFWHPYYSWHLILCQCAWMGNKMAKVKIHGHDGYPARQPHFIQAF
jgi:hypothetical protein